MPRRRSLLFVLLAAALTFGGAAAAEPRDTPYTASWAVDLPVSMAAAAAVGVPRLFLGDLVRGGGPYDAASVNGMDRFVTGWHDAAAGTASDVLLWSLVAWPFAADALDVGVSDGSWRGWAIDSAVIAETLLVAGALNQLTKIAVQRPRPLLYGRPAGDPALDVPDNHLSFYSGHTSTVFAAGLAWAFTFARRHPDSPWRFAVYGGAALAGSTVGLLRMLAGKHFTSDVLVGAAMGTLVGIGVPWLHAKAGSGVSVAPGPGGGAVVMIAIPL